MVSPDLLWGIKRCMLGARDEDAMWGKVGRVLRKGSVEKRLLGECAPTMLCCSVFRFDSVRYVAMALFLCVIFSPAQSTMTEDGLILNYGKFPPLTGEKFLDDIFTLMDSDDGFFDKNVFERVFHMNLTLPKYPQDIKNLYGFRSGVNWYFTGSINYDVQKDEKTNVLERWAHTDIFIAPYMLVNKDFCLSFQQFSTRMSSRGWSHGTRQSGNGMYAFRDEKSDRGRIDVSIDSEPEKGCITNLYMFLYSSLETDDLSKWTGLWCSGRDEITVVRQVADGQTVPLYLYVRIFLGEANSYTVEDTATPRGDGLELSDGECRIRAEMRGLQMVVTDNQRCDKISGAFQHREFNRISSDIVFGHHWRSRQHCLGMTSGPLDYTRNQ